MKHTKRSIAFVLALCMCLSFVPGAFATGSAEDIVFDFNAWLKAHPEMTNRAEMTAEHMENIAPNKTGTAQTSGILWEMATNMETLRLCNMLGDWETQSRGGGNGSNNKVALDITVSAAQEGWYSPSISFLANAATDTLSVYMIANGTASYLGDVNSSSPKTNAVYLEEGTNTLVLCCISAANQYGATFYIKNITFTKLSAEPTASLQSDAPVELGVDAKAENLKAKLAMSDGTSYQFPSRAINATSFFECRCGCGKLPQGRIRGH